MDKICFTTLEIEINRQCNFSCEHCFCGDSEGFFDFNYDKLGTLLEQTKDHLLIAMHQNQSIYLQYQ